MTRQERIYLDYCAGAPLRPSAQAAILEGFRAAQPGNPSSIHSHGRAQEATLAEARAIIASCLQARPFDVILTGSGTEANNLAIFGVTAIKRNRARRLILSAVEHASCLEPARQLEKQGWELVQLPVSRQGRLDLAALERALSIDTALVSIQAANPEAGFTLDVAEAGRLTRKAGTHLHVDASVAAGRIPIGLETFGCDLISISSVKVGGPGGAGALVLRRGISLEPVLWGGPQERGRRPGASPVPLMKGFAEALRASTLSCESEAARLTALTGQIYHAMREHSAGCIRLTPEEGQENILPGVLCLGFPMLEGQSILMNLDILGTSIAAGTPCSSGSLEPPQALLAIGCTDSEARGAIRISLGWATHEDEVHTFVTQLGAVVSRLSSMTRH